MVKHAREEDIVLEVRDLSFSYSGTRVLENVNFCIKRGDFTGLIGSNGAGKSTLIRLLLGRLKPESGDIFMFGENLKRFHDWRRLAYIPQKATAINADFPINVEELVALPLRARSHRLSRSREIRKAVDEALMIVKMRDYAKRPIGQLSGGQQQRVFIAKCLVQKPELLLLDEPTVGVDLEAENEIYRLLQHLNESHGMTIIWVSHDIAAVSRHTNRLLCLGADGFFEHHYGEADQRQTLERIYGHPIRIHSHMHGLHTINRESISTHTNRKAMAANHQIEPQHLLYRDPEPAGIAEEDGTVVPPEVCGLHDPDYLARFSDQAADSENDTPASHNTKSGEGQRDA